MFFWFRFCSYVSFSFFPLSLDTQIIADMLESCPFVNGGISYDQVLEFTMKKFEVGSEDGAAPPYVQLDHVYGLEGIDLNMIGEPLHKWRPPMQVKMMTGAAKVSVDVGEEGSATLVQEPAIQLSPARFGRVRVGARSDLVDPRRSFSLLAFSQLKELKEITNPEDVPKDLFVSPVNVAVVDVCAEDAVAVAGVSQQHGARPGSSSSPPRGQQHQRGRDDSSIKRMTLGSMMSRNSPFSKGQRATMTTPRRPASQRFYLSVCPPAAGINRSSLSSLFMAEESAAVGFAVKPAYVGAY